MFERYTERARRIIYFAQREARTSGSSEITPEHLLLALLEEAPRFLNMVGFRLTTERIRQEVEKDSPRGKEIATSVSLPLSQSSKHVLAYAAQEAERLNDKHIGHEHLLLGVAREEKTVAGRILKEHGPDLELMRESVAGMTPSERSKE